MKYHEGGQLSQVCRCKECPNASMGNPWTCEVTLQEIPVGLANNIPDNCPLPDPTPSLEAQILSESLHRDKDNKSWFIAVGVKEPPGGSPTLWVYTKIEAKRPKIYKRKVIALVSQLGLQTPVYIQPITTPTL